MNASKYAAPRNNGDESLAWRIAVTAAFGILAVAIALLFAGCGGMTAWVMTGQDTDLTARIGAEVSPGIEAGVTGKWTRSSEIEWGPEPDKIGPYAILTGSWIVSQQDTDPPAPFPIRWLADLEAVPYAGVDFVDSDDNGNFSNIEPNWIFGTKFMLDPDGNSAIVVEYIDGDEQTADVSAGVFLRF